VFAAVSYGKVRPRFLDAGPATWAHRASGDTILVLAVLVAVACVSYYGFEEGGAHAVFGCLALAALALKVVAVRLGGSSSRLLPWIGAALFALFIATWLTFRRRLPWGRLMRVPSQGAQILGSLLVALAVVAVTIAVVTAHFGPTSNAELEAREERIDRRLDAQEERMKQRRETADERREAREGD
jgi:Family of unknown function (DUF6529)